MRVGPCLFLYCLAISANAGESVGVISCYFVTLYGKDFFMPVRRLRVLLAVLTEIGQLISLVQMLLRVRLCSLPLLPRMLKVSQYTWLERVRVT